MKKNNFNKAFGKKISHSKKQVHINLTFWDDDGLPGNRDHFQRKQKL